MLLNKLIEEFPSTCATPEINIDVEDVKKFDVVNEFIQKCDFPGSKINTIDLWESWITLRSKSIYYDTINMNIKDTSEMTAQAIWEFEKGSKINEENIKKAINQKLSCLNQVNKIIMNMM